MWNDATHIKGKKMKGSIGLAGLVLGVALLPLRATAIPIPPGGFITPVPMGDAAGPILADTGLIPYSFGIPAGTDTGTAREIVIADSLNPFGAGDLTFLYQVHVTAGEIGRVTGSDYTGFITDVTQFAPHSPFITTGIHPADLADRGSDGAVVGFDFLTPITPDAGTTDTSLALIIRTNATHFTSGSIGLIDGGGATEPGFAPAGVPIPSAAWGGLGLLGLLAFGRIPKFSRSVA